MCLKQHTVRSQDCGLLSPERTLPYKCGVMSISRRKYIKKWSYVLRTQYL